MYIICNGLRVHAKKVHFYVTLNMHLKKSAMQYILIMRIFKREKRKFNQIRRTPAAGDKTSAPSPSV